MRIRRETLATCLDAFTRFINGPQLLAVILQIMRPPSEAWRNFQNRASRQTIANTRKNCAVSLRMRGAPWVRPFLARLVPIVFHLLATDSDDLMGVILREAKNL